jgi:stalled ribosome alternative rescue factor ArfA
LTKTKRNGIKQNEIKPILTKQFLGERQEKNSMEKIEKVSFNAEKG